MREGIIIILGTLAQYLSIDDVRIKEAIESLFKALSTPSYSV